MLAMDTCAPAMAAPLGSVTVPMIFPETACPGVCCGNEPRRMHREKGAIRSLIRIEMTLSGFDSTPNSNRVQSPVWPNAFLVNVVLLNFAVGRNRQEHGVVIGGAFLKAASYLLQFRQFIIP